MTNKIICEEQIQSVLKNKSIHFETAPCYNNTIKPIINTYDRIWLDEIFMHTREVEKIILETDDFILMPSNLWKNMNKLSDFHYLIFFKNPELKSIRDIKLQHLSTINSAVYESLQLIRKLHCFDNSIKFITEFHYHPSVWQLHLHIHLYNSKLINTTRTTYSLNDIIEKIHEQYDYWQTATLMYDENN